MVLNTFQRIFAVAVCALGLAGLVSATEPAFDSQRRVPSGAPIAARDDIALALGGVLLVSEQDLTLAGQRVRADALGEKPLSAEDQGDFEKGRARLDAVLRQADCWWDFSRFSATGASQSVCMEPHVLRAMLAAESIVQDRLDLAFARSGSSGLQHRSVGVVMVLFKLSLSRIALDIHDQQFAAATRRWLALRAALVRIRNAGNAGVWQAVLGLAESHTLQGLEALLFHGPPLDESIRQAVQSALNEPGFSPARLAADLAAQRLMLVRELKKQGASAQDLASSETAFARYAEALLKSLQEKRDPIEAIRELNVRQRAQKADFNLGAEILDLLRRRDREADLLRLRAQLLPTASQRDIERTVVEFNRLHPRHLVTFKVERNLIAFVNPASSILEVRLK